MAIAEELDLRRLSEQDDGLAGELIVLFSSEFKQHLTSPGKAHIVKLLSRSEFICICALHKERVIGGLTAYVLPSMYREHPEIFIYDIAVKKKYRGKGVGKMLIEKLKPFAKDLKIREVFVNASGDDDDALKFYRKIGGKEMQIVQFTFEN